MKILIKKIKLKGFMQSEVRISTFKNLQSKARLKSYYGLNRKGVRLILIPIINPKPLVNST